MFNMTDEHWMKLALEEAEAAMQFGEIPVASILVGDGVEVGRGQTQVRRRGSIAAHGELYAILEAKDAVYRYERLTIYTTLEPCLMCVGACGQAGISRVVFGMRAAPDGAAAAAHDLRDSGLALPVVSGGLLEESEIELMRTFRLMHPESPAIPYVDEMLAHYDG